MTPLTLSHFAARLRERIRLASVARPGASEGPAPFPPRPGSLIPEDDGPGSLGDKTALSGRRGKPLDNPPAPSDGAFEASSLELFALQFAHNPAYRRFCEARSVSPATVADWTLIPAVPTAAFKELEMTCLAPAERTHVFHSSGTTGQRPSRHFHSAESKSLYEASLIPWFARHLLTDSIGRMPMLSLTPPPTAAPQSSLAHMMATVRAQFGGEGSAFVGLADPDDNWTIDLAAAHRWLRDASTASQPVLLLGTAFNLVHLLDSLVATHPRVRLPPGSRVMETGGYKGRSRSLAGTQLHALLTESLGVPASHIICEYGMTELSSQAYDGAVQDSRVEALDSTARSPERVFRFPPWARTQIISPETGREVADGESGLIRVFDLANVWSVMAVQTEDLGVRRGDGFELLGRAARAEPRGCSLMTP